MTAKYAGNTPATPNVPYGGATATLGLTLLPQSLTYGGGGLPLSLTVPGTTTFTVSSDSGQTVTVALAPETPATVCTLSPSATNNEYTLTAVGPGTCTLLITAGGTTTFGIVDVLQPVAIMGVQTISFGPLAAKTYGDADFLVSASSSSNLPVTFGAAGNCTITGSLVHITSAGDCTITASQAGNTLYNAATPVQQNFAIDKKLASVTPNAASKPYGAADPAFTGTLSGFVPADNVTATYSRTAGETVAGSPYTISATLSPAGVLGQLHHHVQHGELHDHQGDGVGDAERRRARRTARPIRPSPARSAGFLAADGVTATYSRTAGETRGGQPVHDQRDAEPGGRARQLHHHLQHGELHDQQGDEHDGPVGVEPYADLQPKRDADGDCRPGGGHWYRHIQGRCDDARHRRAQWR